MIGLALAGGMGAMNMFAGQQQAETEQAIQRAQHAIRLSNYNRQTMIDNVQNLLKNEEISRINQARWRQNRAISKAANETRALQEGRLTRDTGAKLLNISRGHNQSLDSLAVSAVGAGLTPQSGTVKALARQLTENGHAEMTNLKTNDYLTRQNIIQQQENALAKRDLYSWNQGSYYLPGPAPTLVQQEGTSFLQDASAFMGGVSQGVGLMGNVNKALGDSGQVNWGASVGNPSGWYTPGES